VKPAPLLLLAAALLAVLAGCGSSDAGPTEDDSDKRAVAFECITEDKEIAARLDGEDSIALNGDGGAPRIKFYLTAAEAESAQFKGDAEGAEQIGSALLFVEPTIREQTEALLEDVEACLADL
jgi:hypothetical protein